MFSKFTIDLLNQIPEAHLSGLYEELDKNVPIGLNSHRLYGYVLKTAIDKNVVISKYEYDNQVQVNKTLKQKLNKFNSKELDK